MFGGVVDEKANAERMNIFGVINGRTPGEWKVSGIMAETFQVIVNDSETEKRNDFYIPSNIMGTKHGIYKYKYFKISKIRTIACAAIRGNINSGR